MTHVVEADSRHPSGGDLRFEMAHQIARQEGTAGSGGENPALLLPIGLPAQHILGCLMPLEGHHHKMWQHDQPARLV